jgi:hypothetical protein
MASNPPLSETKDKIKGGNKVRCSVSQKGKTHLFNITMRGDGLLYNWMTLLIGEGLHL